MTKTIIAKEKFDCSHLLGQFLDETHYDTLIEEDTDFYIPTTSLDKSLNENRVGFIFRKNHFTLEEQIGCYEGLNRAADVPSNNRGLASGPKVEKVGNRDWLTNCQWEIITYFKKNKSALPGFDPVQDILDRYKNGETDTSRGCMWLYYPTKRDNFNFDKWLERVRYLPAEERKKEAEFVDQTYISLSTYASPVLSGVAGSQPRYPRFPYVRLAAYNRNYPQEFEKSFPFLNKLSESFREFLPHRWENQLNAANSIDPYFVIDKTVFSTITVNKTFRTGAHYDAGDLASGFSNLSVISDGKSDFTGGYLVLPEYKTAIAIRPGDLLLVANHDIMHGNTPIEGFRMSIVAYFREDLIGTGSKEYEQARSDYVKSRVDNPNHPLQKKLWNGISPGMFEEQEWYDFLEAQLGKDILEHYHPNALPNTFATLF